MSWLVSFWRAIRKRIKARGSSIEAERDDHDQFSLDALTEADELLTDWETQEEGYLCAEYVMSR